MPHKSTKKILINNRQLANTLKLENIPIVISNNILIKIIQKIFGHVIVYWIRRYDEILNWMRNDFHEVYWSAIWCLFININEINNNQCLLDDEMNVDQYLNGKLKFHMKSQKNLRMKKQESFERAKNLLSAQKTQNLLMDISIKQNGDNIFAKYDKLSLKITKPEREFVDKTLKSTHRNVLPYIKKNERIILNNIRQQYNNMFIF